MKYKKRILLILGMSMILAGCGNNTYKQGVENLENGNYAAAEEQLQQAVADEKNVADSYRGIGIACYEQEKYGEAVTALEAAIAAGAKETTAIYNLMGASEMKLEQYAAAITYYEKGIALADGTDEMLQEMRFNVIVSYEKTKDWESAKQKLTEYTAAYPEDEKAKKEAEFLETR